MISRITFCSAQPFDDALGALGPDAGHLAQALGALLDDVEHRLAERLDQLAGVDRADALDHAGAEILLDALERGRRGGAQEGGLELQAVGAVVDPGAAGLDELAGADRGGGADHGDQLALAADLDPQHAEAVLGVVEGDPLDQAGQGLALGGRGGAPPGVLGRHAGHGFRPAWPMGPGWNPREPAEEGRGAGIIMPDRDGLRSQAAQRSSAASWTSTTRRYDGRTSVASRRRSPRRRGQPTTEPSVIGWMPAAAVFFHDPDGHLLEYLAMLPHQPRPEAGVVPYGEWMARWAGEGPASAGPPGTRGAGER